MAAIVIGTILYIIIFFVAAFFIQDYVTKQTNNEKVKSEWRL
jgi:phosphotransferase system  glucose/maltose/N-acetylglucosamine-specific IIC component